MRKFGLVIIACFGISFLTIAQNQSSDLAYVYILRSTGMQGSLWKFKILIDNEILCSLGNNKYSSHEIKAGAHLFSAKFSGKKTNFGTKPILIDVKPGNTYYIQLAIVDVISVVTYSELHCEQISERQSDVLFEKLSEEKKCK